MRSDPAPASAGAGEPAYGPRGPGAANVPESRYLTLSEVLAIECNGCGDCCGSERSDGFWTWGPLPESQYRALNQGAALIIPIERIDGSWRDRAWVESDTHRFTPTRFRCTALTPVADGGGTCALHASERPAQCGEFPLGGSEIQRALGVDEEAWLQTDAFPRCSWFRICVVRDDDARRTR